ncbi:acylphosphatase [Arvimicrobium flavum]|uniref:acylphosphatase n=1 Tax=Arvimicrobium flavum TaxID=3393320 RepID=UPI00237C4F3C|nr:acylphosphatase [Mesorhizobium shangrilense]
MIKHAAFVRNLHVERISVKAYRVSDSHRVVSFWGPIPDTTSLVARRVANSKNVTKQVLQGAGLNVPNGSVFDQDQEDRAWTFVTEIGGPVVVKPTHGSGGRGVTSNIQDRDHFSLAWKVARSAKRKPVIVEQHISGNDFRLFVIGDHLRAAIQRVPAYVEGDGQTSIAGLVEKKNQARKAIPYVGAKPIKFTPAILHNLEARGLSTDSVLTSGERLYLHLVANIGGGGESIDVTGTVHPDFADIAVRARKALPSAIHCGVDLLAEDITRSPGEQRWAICEVNSVPDIAMHHFPISGTPRDVAGELIEHLFPGNRLMEERLWRKVRVEVVGQVTNVGFRQWFRRTARLRGLTGWVRNVAEDKLEAVICGPPGR